jgi:hypothetical protein
LNFAARGNMVSFAHEKLLWSTTSWSFSISCHLHHVMQFGGGVCLSRSYNMLLQPKGGTVSELEFEEVADFYHRL